MVQTNTLFFSNLKTQSLDLTNVRHLTFLATVRKKASKGLPFCRSKSVANCLNFLVLLFMRILKLDMLGGGAR